MRREPRIRSARYFFSAGALPTGSTFQNATKAALSRSAVKRVPSRDLPEAGGPVREAGGDRGISLEDLHGRVLGGQVMPIASGRRETVPQASRRAAYASLHTRVSSPTKPGRLAGREHRQQAEITPVPAMAALRPAGIQDREKWPGCVMEMEAWYYGPNRPRMARTRLSLFVKRRGRG